MGLSKSDIHFKIFYFLLLIALSTIPFTKFLLLPILILLLLNFIIEWNWKEKFKLVKDQKLDKFLLLFISLFLLYFIGFFYSSEKISALSSLECKLAFFVAPLTIFTVNKSLFTINKIAFLLKIFIVSCFLLILTNLSISLLQFLKYHSIDYFFYSSLSHFMHPSYISMFLVVALSISFYFLFNYYKKPTKLFKYFLWTTIPLFSIFIILLQSKAGILTFGILIFIFVLYFINKNKKRVFYSTIFILLTLFLSYLVIFKLNVNSNRLHQAVEVVSQKNSTISMNNSKDGTLQRIDVWEIAWDLSLQNLPFGVGTGDSKKELMKRYEENQLTNILRKELNAHNQYLQTFLTLGIVGLLLLLAIFLVPMKSAIKYKHFPYIVFIIAILLNFLVESMLERRDGTNFIALFNCLFCYMMIYMHDKPTLPHVEEK